jgi:hypothetical protein
VSKLNVKPELFVGVWELDPSTLDYQYGRPGRRAMYTIEPAAGGLMFTLDGEDADGKPLKFTYGGSIDGLDHPIADGVTLALGWVDDCSIESVLKRGGSVADRWVRTIQAGGQAMTITQRGVRPDGTVFQVMEVRDTRHLRPPICDTSGKLFCMVSPKGCRSRSNQCFRKKFNVFGKILNFSRKH